MCCAPPILPPLTNHRDPLRSWRTPSQSPPHAPPQEDATMASEPTLSSLAQLAAIRISQRPRTHAIESTSVEALRPHAAQKLLTSPTSSSSSSTRAIRLGVTTGWLVEEELCRHEAEGKRLVFVLNKIGTCASTHALRFSSHQHYAVRGAPVIARRFGAARECLGMAQPPPPHNLNAPLPSPRARISARTSPLEPHLRPQGVQTQRSAECHRRRRRLPECRQEQSNQHPQARQGEVSRLS
jgi:hypothetical protein